jgi:hypothetical protein
MWPRSKRLARVNEKRPRKAWKLAALLVGLPIMVIAGLEGYSQLERALLERRARADTLERLRLAQTVEAECQVYAGILMAWAWQNNTEVSVEGQLFYAHQAPYGITQWMMLRAGELAPCHRRLHENEAVRHEARDKIQGLIAGRPFYQRSTREQLEVAF